MSEQPKSCLLKQFHPYRIPANHSGMPDALKKAMQCTHYQPVGRKPWIWLLPSPDHRGHHLELGKCRGMDRDWVRFATESSRSW
jgi:hypothetical protein